MKYFLEHIIDVEFIESKSNYHKFRNVETDAIFTAPFDPGIDSFKVLEWTHFLTIKRKPGQTFKIKIGVTELRSHKRIVIITDIVNAANVSGQRKIIEDKLK